MEGLKVSDADLVLRVPPSKSSRASQAILRELSSHLFQFSEIFDGVLLAYDVDIVDQNAKIIQVIQPSSGVRLKAKLLLFSPKPNMSLEGRVVKLTPESIHVIVLGFASAVIIDEDIREEFEFRTKHGKEVFRSKAHSRHVIKVGTVIRFLVKSLDKEILHICGSLKPTNTGSIHWLDNNVIEISLTDRSGMKRESENEMERHEHAVLGGEKISVCNDQIKKSKKRRLREES
ncbi:DNA-directed RNA polymerase I subunit rpa43-like isoform X2 [Rhodamnia argentea]|uniref:DNA-directed RNA polymerase subunit n=1 Tax=Rhodamnia argentea TaxID=178133 RepID=A0A8B8MQZ9_9MYRT|nr:DNA-directed RNA polymerase I subunit rpa43-like isoform X2 [Rhodamnia argentea]